MTQLTEADKFSPHDTFDEAIDWKFRAESTESLAARSQAEAVGLRVALGKGAQA